MSSVSDPEGGFVPQDWTESLLHNFIAGIKSYDEMMLGPEEQRRRGHVKKTAYSKAELRERREAVKRWKEITKELTAKGWLEHEHCYECGGELVPSKETVRTEWVYDETEEEHLARVGAPYRAPTVTFNFATKKVNLDTPRTGDTTNE